MFYKQSMIFSLQSFAERRKYRICLWGKPKRREVIGIPFPIFYKQSFVFSPRASRKEENIEYGCWINRKGEKL